MIDEYFKVPQNSICAIETSLHGLGTADCPDGMSQPYTLTVDVPSDVQSSEHVLKPVPISLKLGNRTFDSSLVLVVPCSTDYLWTTSLDGKQSNGSDYRQLHGGATEIPDSKSDDIQFSEEGLNQAVPIMISSILVGVIMGTVFYYLYRGYQKQEKGKH